MEVRGSHDYLLPDVVKAIGTLPVVPHNLTVCTDDVFPEYLVEKGGMAERDLTRQAQQHIHAHPSHGADGDRAQNQDLVIVHPQQAHAHEQHPQPSGLVGHAQRWIRGPHTFLMLALPNNPWGLMHKMAIVMPKESIWV